MVREIYQLSIYLSECCKTWNYCSQIQPLHSPGLMALNSRSLHISGQTQAVITIYYIHSFISMHYMCKYMHCMKSKTGKVACMVPALNY